MADSITMAKTNRYMIQIIDSRTGAKSPAFICTPIELIEASNNMGDLTPEQTIDKTEYYEHALVDVLADAEKMINLDPETEDVSMCDLILAVPIFKFSTFEAYFGEYENV